MQTCAALQKIYKALCRHAWPFKKIYKLYAGVRGPLKKFKKLRARWVKKVFPGFTKNSTIFILKTYSTEKNYEDPFFYFFYSDNHPLFV